MNKDIGCIVNLQKQVKKGKKPEKDRNPKGKKETAKSSCPPLRRLTKHNEM